MSDIRPLSSYEKNNLYGGWKWLIALIPYLIQSIITSIGAYKSIESIKGSIKGQGIEAKWDNDVKNRKPADIVFYAY